jgi:uncharacterized Zn finger protein
MRRWSYWDDWPRYRKSQPREVRGGIKAQSKQGKLGQSWWAKRWLGVLESFSIGARLTRGRSYARKGQVMRIDVDTGMVQAQVQGSRATPYVISIKMKTLTAREWKRLAGELSSEAIFLAKLLAGEMPQEIEQAFSRSGLSLFPEKLRDLETTCSCPDWSNPCKHIAAVYYLLGEEFDRDPFLIFKLRGADRETLLNLLDAGWAKRRDAVAETVVGGAEVSTVSFDPLSADPERFWQGDSLPDDIFGEVAPPPVSAPPLRRVGNFPFWRGRERLFDALEPVYEAASQRGLDAFVGMK